MPIADEVTLVVPAHGRPDLTMRLLQSLVDSSADYEVILVDDASQPPLLEQIRSFPSLRVRYVYCEHKAGPAAARNVGIREARTDYVAFTDNDVAITPGWMSSLHRHLSSAPMDVAGVGGKVVDDGSNLVGRYATCLGLLNPFIRRGRVLYLVTANCLFRQRALLSVGGFDEGFGAPGGEDPELSFRLLAAGYRLEYLDEAVVSHRYASSWRSFYRTFCRYGRGCHRAMRSLQAATNVRIQRNAAAERDNTCVNEEHN